MVRTCRRPISRCTRQPSAVRPTATPRASPSTGPRRTRPASLEPLDHPGQARLRQQAVLPQVAQPRGAVRAARQGEQDVVLADAQVAPDVVALEAPHERHLRAEERLPRLRGLPRPGQLPRAVGHRPHPPEVHAYVSIIDSTASPPGVFRALRYRKCRAPGTEMFRYLAAPRPPTTTVRSGTWLNEEEPPWPSHAHLHPTGAEPRRAPSPSRSPRRSPSAPPPSRSPPLRRRPP